MLIVFFMVFQNVHVMLECFSFAAQDFRASRDNQFAKVGASIQAKLFAFEKLRRSESISWKIESWGSEWDWIEWNHRLSSIFTEDDALPKQKKQTCAVSWSKPIDACGTTCWFLCELARWDCVMIDNLIDIPLACSVKKDLLHTKKSSADLCASQQPRFSYKLQVSDQSSWHSKSPIERLWLEGFVSTFVYQVLS